jgi:hypothetical protein
MRAAARSILIALIAIFVTACLVAEAAYAQNSQPAFRRGVGISHIMAWAPLEPAPSRNFVFPPFSYPAATFGRELKALRRSGFDFVRFAIDPGPFLQWQGERREYLMKKLVGYVRLILSSDLSVIVDFHPSDMHPEYLANRSVADSNAPLFKDYLRVITQTAVALKELQSPRVALEIMNEPPMRAQLWRPMRDAAYSTVRKAAPRLLLVLDGGEEGNLEGTIALDTIRDDPNILYSFHYYRPWQFTHQGMAGMAAEYFTDVPYPATARPMEESIAATIAATAAAKLTSQQRVEVQTKARHDLETYRTSRFDRPDIAGDFNKVARWARDHSIPADRILLGEFGAMDNAQRGIATRQAERLRWLSDVRKEAEAHGFTWAAWVYRGSIGFSLVERDGSSELDPGVLRVLGLE